VSIIKAPIRIKASTIIAPMPTMEKIVLREQKVPRCGSWVNLWVLAQSLQVFVGASKLAQA
jgi:hypothetical protein